MKSGLKCYPVKALVIVMLIFTIVLGIAYWLWMQPGTPEQLFRVRCASCHDLWVHRLCEFDPDLRPAIVQVMRNEYGADQIISQNEAVVIQQYLREVFKCR